MKKHLHNLEISWVGWLLLVALCSQGIYFAWVSAWSEVFVVVAALVFSIAPYVIATQIAIKPNQAILTGVVAFVFSTLVLGEIYKFYHHFLWWDVFLHILAGIGLPLLGYVWIYNLIQDDVIAARPTLHTVLVFSSSVTVLTLWEVYEFVIDQLQWSSSRMQPSLYDTMTDVVLGLSSTLIVCFGGLVLLHRKHTSLRRAVSDES